MGRVTKTGSGRATVRMLRGKAGVLSFLLAVLLVFAGAENSEAVKRTFGPVEADVPDGWSVEETDDQLTFPAPENAAGLTTIIEMIEGTTVKEVAEKMAQELKGDTPKASEGGFAFTFKNPNGIDCDTFVGGEEEIGFYMVMIKAGDHPQLDGLIDSLEFNEP